jgi:hypothetical protein
MSLANDEAWRMGAIDTSIQVGRMADQVVLVTIRTTDENHALSESEARAIDEATIWLRQMVSVITDPLDLSTSLPSLSTIDLLRRFGGDGLHTLIGSAPSRPNADPTPDTDAVLVGGLEKLVEDLTAIRECRFSTEDLTRVRLMFDGLARSMLATTESVLNTPTGDVWKTSFAF